MNWLFLLDVYASVGIALAIMLRITNGPPGHWWNWVVLTLFWPLILIQAWRTR